MGNNLTLECDEMDQLIARHYVNNPEATHAEVADALEQPLRTVERRISKMIERAVLVRRTDINDWAALGYPFRYRIDVHVDQEALRDPPEFGAPPGEMPKQPKEEVKDWRRLAQYIMKDLLAFVERSNNTVTNKKISKDDLIVQNVTILLGQQADLSVTLRSRTPDAILSFVVDGLRSMRGVRATTTAHEAWSYIDKEL